MKKAILSVCSLFSLAIAFGQKVNSPVVFEQGQLLQVQTDFKSTVAQQAFGQSVDFNTRATVLHTYKVTNATADNSTLRHATKQLTFNFEGMGQKRPFDSNNEKDMKGPFGPAVKDIVDKTYDMIVSPSGTVLMAFPEKFTSAETDDRVKMVTGMLRDVFEIVNPPKKGTASFFGVFPAREVAKGETWSESYENASGKFNNTYTLAEIGDSTLTVTVAGTSTTSSKADVMGMQISTTLNNKSTGTIIVNKANGIVKEKEVITESTGTTTGMGGETPLTAKTTMKTVVTAVKE